mmetsp:Transcript_47568/g.102536  ORF Transcript_47568/g.102536 Transcript_47568/m.102536 type:complete len:113 (-) Transcript_47568:855-1193(-)|eukprot:CAMPEP_0194755276 /NCGR_PEP_ID=MMETSP0323_2-20130528/9174_1 /TAXON_ID=2866 ORGANISM="Crypthecodinium cohnii, Strain Seligo" /NCGR_SAMPLE_ID=MMETSP0323_2 /ASSEMBLY_ACC=CAM_ASM_000346 /LENGTH=112 /DNA_ID=CAMNT_0039674265 /DNA_START=228 /DNA_END=566 /DNA_ORIENTATION=-
MAESVQTKTAADVVVSECFELCLQRKVVLELQTGRPMGPKVDWDLSLCPVLCFGSKLGSDELGVESRGEIVTADEGGAAGIGEPSAEYPERWVVSLPSAKAWAPRCLVASSH